MFDFFTPLPHKKDLMNFVEKLETAAKAMEAQSLCFRSLGDEQLQVVSKEAPSFRLYFERIQEVYENLSDIYLKSYRSVCRSIEDLKDINYRFVAFVQMDRDRITFQKKYVSACNKLGSTKLLFDKSKPETIENYKTSFFERNEIASELLDKTKCLLQQKKKFELFSSRRMKSAWERYGETLSNLYVMESASMNELSILYKSIRDHAGDQPKLMSKYLTPMTSAIPNHENKEIPKSNELSFIIPSIPDSIKYSDVATCLNTKQGSSNTLQESPTKTSEEIKDELPVSIFEKSHNESSDDHEYKQLSDDEAFIFPSAIPQGNENNGISKDNILDTEKESNRYVLQSLQHKVDEPKQIFGKTKEVISENQSEPQFVNEPSTIGEKDRDPDIQINSMVIPDHMTETKKPLELESISMKKPQNLEAGNDSIIEETQNVSKPDEQEKSISPEANQNRGNNNNRRSNRGRKNKGNRW